MLPNTGRLTGCTIFITGASRGIGKAIALKAAKDGANVVIAAKTAQTHPKLPGTIYTAAEEIEAAGGKALPCIVDVRDEQQISTAVEKAVEKFGGIDILVNNASAISLTNTMETPTKKVDLMMNVNTRGTYLTSKACIPFLKKSKIAHILNLSPPLNLNPVWFKQHCAYTIAKYGMSMCVLGMAEEFKGEIAVNALWPKTGQPLLPDFFLDEYPDAVMKKRESQGAVPELKEEKSQPQAKPHSGPVEETFRIVKDALSDDVVKATQAIYQFELSGEDGGTWFLDLKSKGGKVGHGEPSDRADVVMSMSTDDFVKMFSGKLKPTMAFMSGKLKIKGNMALAIKLEKLMSQMHSRL
ncbi:PREDICTED: hydroxysteroid dehydrogenase-like protein 2 isoform X2 [Chinchilla lanigera]|uniref:hydroxysteroid dehydrogenase-like protein 2 isoform X2 n=1 Tax=Chinchilla lanigera TaxID=34839 RepID=UPI000698427C|nr:PREDICTED: hydroxysteroid dehydrogenase-like protein 2 isoform X2 [Chinchilla lanigera]